MANLILATDFYKIVTTIDIRNAIDYLLKHNLKLIKSTKYDVLLPNGETIPPKELMRYTADLMGYKIDEQDFYGGLVNEPLKKLGFTIVDKKGNVV